MPRVPEELLRKRRRKLIQTAAKQFLQNGYNNTTIDNIIGELKLAKGTFYYHFKSKDELLMAVCENIVSDTADALSRIRDKRNKSIHSRINALRKRLYDTFHRNQDIWVPVYHESNAILYDRVIKVSLSRLGPIVAGILEDGIQQGVLKLPHAAEAAETILIMYDHYCKQYVGTDDEKKQKRIYANLEYMMGLLLGGQQINR